MTKLINKFQEGGTTYKASYSLPEIKVTDKQPEWFKYLNDYDKSRLKSGQITTETAKSIAQKRATGISQYMQDVNKLSWIPNGAMAVAGGMALAGAPQAASVLGNTIFTADVLRAAEEGGIKQAVKENAPYLLTAGLFTPISNGYKIIKGALKGARDAKTAIKGVKETTKVAKNFDRNLIQRIFTEEISPAIEGKPGISAKPAQVYNPTTKSWENLPEGVTVSTPYKEGLVKTVQDNNGLHTVEGQIGTSKYTSAAINKINNSKPYYVNIIAPDKTLYGKYLQSAYKASVPEVKAIEAIPAKYGPNWLTITTATLTPFAIGKSINTSSKEEQDIPQENNYTSKTPRERYPEYFQ